MLNVPIAMNFLSSGIKMSLSGLTLFKAFGINCQAIPLHLKSYFSHAHSPKIFLFFWNLAPTDIVYTLYPVPPILGLDPKDNMRVKYSEFLVSGWMCCTGSTKGICLDPTNKEAFQAQLHFKCNVCQIRLRGLEAGAVWVCHVWM